MRAPVLLQRPLLSFAPAAVGLGLVVALGLWAGAGCRGVVGACSGGDCPRLPGCEDSPVTCDPDHVCVEQVCEGVGWICGVDAEGEYSWLNRAAPCDDGDPCTIEDLCLEGRCVGSPNPCSTPPPNTCVSATTLKVWSTTGSCAAGVCGYGAKEYPCPEGCQNGACVGAPCTGITCDRPGPCEAEPGTCIAGECVYGTVREGSSCDPQDSCVQFAVCDADGNCTGTAIDCTRPHASGGTCIQGSCQGFVCDADWGNCNDTWDDGCEEPLDTINNCGKCGKSCAPVSHGVPSCAGGVCVAKCNDPYADCDKKYSNGCEREVGVANVCNRDGMAAWSGSTPPCGTAHCGSSTSDKAENFGSWYCLFCSHCQKKPDGNYSWCLSSTGNFSPQSCVAPDCGCDPQSATYPQLCEP